jgi:hypothetical protein
MAELPDARIANPELRVTGLVDHEMSRQQLAARAPENGRDGFNEELEIQP